MTTDRQGKQSALDRGLPETVGNEAQEALSAAGKALDEMALKGPLPPYAEWACDLILEAEGNPIEHVEMFSGPHLQYSWLAKVTRDPMPQGLDGGRVLFFDLVRTIDSPVREAPDLKDAEKYERWLEDLPQRNIHMARYKNSKLTRYVDDRVTDALIAEIKETCARRDNTRPVDARSVDQALSAARDALFNLDLERGLSPDAEKARDLCSDALEMIEQSRDGSPDRKVDFDSGKESAVAKDEAVARAIARVKQKEDQERQAGDRGHGREQGKE